jgi:glycosidase
MKKKVCLLAILITLILALASCGKGKYGEYGYRIEEDLKTTNIIDDNYGNYYEIFVRSFYDSDGNGIGDLQGVIQKLDYIKDLGFTGIWLMPINKSSSYHKYNVDDYYQIDPQYGTMADLEQLITECHNRGIKLIIDLVLNHSGSSNPLFRKALNAHEKQLAGLILSDEEEKFKDFYTFYDSKSDIPSGTTAYPTRGGLFYYEANFSSDMPEFNYDNPYVYEEVKNIMKFYLNKGLDGFRLDAVKYFYFNNHTKNVEVLRKINQMAKEINPKSYIVGECWDSKEVIAKYYESGIDSFFNFPASVTNPYGYILNGINREGDALNTYFKGMNENIELAGDYIPAPFIDNHDTVRFTSIRNFRNSKYQYALLSMLNGNTFTYYGDEVGMVGSKEVDQNVRIPILWGEENENGDCSLISGVTTDELTRYIYPTVSEQIEDPDSFYNFYKKCLLIRNQNPEIARGSIELVAMDRDVDKLLFISKEYNGSKIGIIFNFSPYYDLNIDITQYGYSKVVGQIVVDYSEKYIGELKDGTIMMPSYSIAIVK